MDSLPWVEKYRPSQFNELIGNTEIIRVVSQLIESKNFPHMLFYGQAGTGKTSLILTCAKKLYGDNFTSMVLEMNASDNRGIEVVRNQIKSFASTKTLFSKQVKLIILDEADQMTSTAQYALRKMIEQHTNNVRFCLICNTITNIIPALQSRCTKFRFLPIEKEQIKKRLLQIKELENILIDDEGMNTLISISNGDMRQSLNLLQSLSFEPITSSLLNEVTQSVPSIEIQKMITFVKTNTFKDSFEYIVNMNKHSCGLSSIIVGLMNVLLSTADKIIMNLADLEYQDKLVNNNIRIGVLVSLLQV